MIRYFTLILILLGVITALVVVNKSMESNSSSNNNNTPADCFICNIFRFCFPPPRDILVEEEQRFLDHKPPSVLQTTTTTTTQQPLPPPVPPNTTTPLMNIDDDDDDDDVEKTELDFTNADYRGFIFATHEDHGFLLLHCTRKKKKPHHFQLPGGHVDTFEFTEAKAKTNNVKDQLLLAGKLGAARELYEETGLDIRESLDRIRPTKLYQGDKKHKLPNEYKGRLFYSVSLRDDDFLTAEQLSSSQAAFLQRPLGANPPDLQACTF